MKILPILLKGGGGFSLAFVAGNMIQAASSSLRSNLNKNVFEDSVSAPVVSPDFEGLLEMYRAKPSPAFIKNRMSPSVKFEDPLSMCSGHDEVFKVFRALRVLRPQILHYKVEGNALYIRMGYIMYGKPIILESKIYVVYDMNGKISSVTEQWNDVPLLKNLISKTIRRINGYLFIKKYTTEKTRSMAVFSNSNSRL